MNEGPKKVQVLTAGGAGSNNSSRKRRNRARNKKFNKKGNNNAASTDNRTNENHTDDRDETERDNNNGKTPNAHNVKFKDNPAAAVETANSFLEFEPSLRPHDQDNGDDDANPFVSEQQQELYKQQEENERLGVTGTVNNRSTGTEASSSIRSTTTDGSNSSTRKSELIWLFICFLGIMVSFVLYGLLLEYTTSGGRKLHELSFLFVTSGLYTITAAAGRYVRAEKATTIPPARFAVLAMTSMGSTFCSVRSLRYVIYPIQVLAKSCKPVPVMLMGAVMGKKYPFKKYVNVVLIVLGVALFMGGGGSGKHHDRHDGNSTQYAMADNTTSTEGDENSHFARRVLVAEDEQTSTASRMFGILLLFVSLCFDGGTGAYEDKLMSVHSVQPFDLMYNIQLGKTILAGIGLLVFNQLHIFVQMCNDMGFLLLALGLSGAFGQVFIFVTISKFGALTCSIIGLARKVTTLIASIYFYGHSLNTIQSLGLMISIGAMVLNFWGKKSKKISDSQTTTTPIVEETKSTSTDLPEEMKAMLSSDPQRQLYRDDAKNNGIVVGEGEDGDVELAFATKPGDRQTTI